MKMQQGSFLAVLFLAGLLAGCGSSGNIPSSQPAGAFGSNGYLAILPAVRPSEEDVLHELADGIAGGRLADTELGAVSKYTYEVDGVPFDAYAGFPFGPDTHQNVYSNTRRFFPVAGADGRAGVIWESLDDHEIHLTWLATDLLAADDSTLPNEESSEYLAAATFAPGGILYYLTIEEGDGMRRNNARSATLYKVSAAGKLLASHELDTGREGLNMVTFEQDVASLSCNGKYVAMIVGRRMHKSRDGLNHQGGIAAVFDADTLTLVKNLGQTSGHSFESVLMPGESGEFIGLDLGDNYPRGINLHRIDSTRMSSRVVYTFKTEHGREARSPAGERYRQYPDKPGYYQWSNDNRTYTELGGVVRAGNGYAVLFASEHDGAGKSLDITRVGRYLNDSRNVGFVLVSPEFQNLSDNGSEVQDKMILSAGETEAGGFYTFGGKWSPQRNTGVVWLTDYANRDTENASRLKAVPLDDESIMLLWEQWTAYRYVSTWGMRISGSGEKLSTPVELGPHVRLSRRDDVMLHDGKIYVFNGNAYGRKLELAVIDPRQH